jgi:hypothetical protein
MICPSVLISFSSTMTVQLSFTQDIIILLMQCARL